VVGAGAAIVSAVQNTLGRIEEKMKEGENIFTADARELEYRRPARRRGITKLMRTPPRGAVRSVRRMPRGEERLEQ